MPKFMVSAVPIIPIANSMLLQILAACDKKVRNTGLHKYNITHSFWYTKEQEQHQGVESDAYLSCANLTAVHYIGSHAA